MKREITDQERLHWKYSSVELQILKKCGYTEDMLIKASGHHIPIRLSLSILAKRVKRIKGKSTEKAIKFRLIALYGSKCMYCGLDLTHIPIHLDHIIPRSKRGVHTIGNRALACPMCNRAKHDMSLDEFKKWLYHIRSNNFCCIL